MFVALIGLQLSACTNGTPNISAIGSLFLASPSFVSSDQQGKPDIEIVDFDGTATLKGNCDKRTTEILLSLDGDLGPWQSPPSTTTSASSSAASSGDLAASGEVTKADSDFSDGEFTLLFPDAGKYFGFDPATPSTKKIYIKANTKYGFTNASVLSVSYNPGAAFTAIISGAPTGTNPIETLSITVGGDLITHYAYKVGLAASTDCAIAADYSASSIAVAAPISDDISALADGEIRLCVVGSNGIFWQNYADATAAAWTKRTQPPSAPSALTLNLPTASPSTVRTPLIDVHGVQIGDTVNLYLSSTCDPTSAMGSTTAAGNTTSIMSATLPTDGTYEYYASVIDPYGLESACSSAKLIYQLDTTGPAIPTSVTLVNPTTSPGVSLTPTLQVSPVVVGDSVAIFTDATCSPASKKAEALATSTTMQLTSLTLTSGLTYKFYAQASDPLGNTLGCSTANVTYAPNTSGPGEFTIAGVNSATGDTTIDAYLSHVLLPKINWGSATDAASYEVTIFETNSTTVKCPMVSVATLSYYFSSCTLANNTDYKVKVIAKNALGTPTVATNSMYSFRVDTTAPVLTFASPAADTAGVDGLTITGTCETGLPVSISGTGVSATSSATCSSSTFSKDILFSSGDGSKTVTISQTDAAGNLGSISQNFVRDTSAPTPFSILGIRNGIGSDSTNDGFLTGSLYPKVMWTASTGVNNFDVSIYSADGATVVCPKVNAGTNTEYDFSTCALVNNTSYKAKVLAKNALGTITNATNTMYPFTVDISAPIITFSSPDQNTAGVNGLTITGTCESGLQINISGSGVNGPTTATCSAGSFSAPILFSSGDGTKVVTLDQTDAAGNVGTDTRSFVRDTTAPGPFNITGVTNTVGTDSTLDAFLTKTLLPKINWGSATTAATYDITIYEDNGTTVKCATENSAVQFLGFGSCTLSDNTYYKVAVVAKNALGTATPATNSPYQFYVDNTLPTIAFTSPAATTTGGSGLTITGTCESGLTVNISGDVAATSVMCSSSAFSKVIVFTAGSGSKSVTIAQTDAAGNSGYSTRNFVSDIDPPTVAIDKSVTQVTPTTSPSSEFTVTFSKPIDETTFTTADIVQIGTVPLLATDWSIIKTSSTLFTIRVNSLPAEGSVIPQIAASSVADLYGNYNAVAAASVTPVVYYATALVVKPVYGANIGDANTNWMDYIKFETTAGGNDAYTQVGNACDASETGYYGEVGGCIHSGEKRKLVVNGYSSCSNLTVVDSLNAFEWICKSDASTSNIATFYTKKLGAGKGLRDLLDSSGSWKPMSVSIFLSGAPLSSTDATAWWTNPIVNLSTFNNSSTANVLSLSTAGTIYYTNADRATFAYHVNANKVAVVTLGTSKLTKYGPAANPNNCSASTGAIDLATGVASLLCIQGVNFGWIEATLDGYSAEVPALYGIIGGNLKYFRFHRNSVTRIHKHPSSPGFSISLSCPGPGYGNLLTDNEIFDVGSGIKLGSYCDNNTIRNLVVATSKFNFSTATSLEVRSSYNRFFDTRIADHGGTNPSQALLLSNANYNSFLRTNISNVNGSGIAIEASSYNIFTQTILTGTNSSAINFKAGAGNNNIFRNSTIANISTNGINFTSGASANANLFSSTVIANTTNGLLQDGGSTGSSNKFYDSFIANSSDYGANFSSPSFATAYGFLNLKNNALGDNFSSNLMLGGGLISRFTNDLSNAFIGKSFVGDTANPADDQYGVSFSLTSLAAWTKFESWTRNWGKNDAGFFPDPVFRGMTSTNNFRYWDWKAASGGVLHNKSYDGESSNVTLNTNNSACTPGTVLSNDNFTNSSMTFLRNAIEIDGDGVGNDNGLCENNENCEYTPNVGAHQGMGALSAGHCTLGSPFSGTKIFKRTAN